MTNSLMYTSKSMIVIRALRQAESKSDPHFCLILFLHDKFYSFYQLIRQPIFQIYRYCRYLSCISCRYLIHFLRGGRSPYIQDQTYKDARMQVNDG